MGNAIEVVIKNNDQKYFLSILANQRRFNSLTNFPFFFHQHFESFVLNTQNPLKRALNKEMVLTLRKISF